MKFEYSPYEEDIVICGAKGTRKTTLCKSILRTLKSCNYWVYDYSWRFDKDHFAVYDAHVINDMKLLNATGKFIFQPFNKSQETFDQFCNLAATKTNLIIVVDEIHQYVKKQQYPKALYSIVMSLRNKGISGIYISTLPAAIPNFILTNAEHVFSFRLNIVDHVKYLRDWLGVEAWLLLPKDKRKEMKNYENLPDHSFVYRKQSESKAQIGEI